MWAFNVDAWQGGRDQRVACPSPTNAVVLVVAVEARVAQSGRMHLSSYPSLLTPSSLHWTPHHTSCIKHATTRDDLRPPPRGSLSAAASSTPSLYSTHVLCTLSLLPSYYIHTHSTHATRATTLFYTLALACSASWGERPAVRKLVWRKGDGRSKRMRSWEIIFRKTEKAHGDHCPRMQVEGDTSSAIHWFFPLRYTKFPFVSLLLSSWHDEGLKRCGKSCRLRWINYLRSDLKRGNISPEEERLILKLHGVFGNRYEIKLDRHQ